MVRFPATATYAERMELVYKSLKKCLPNKVVDALAAEVEGELALYMLTTPMRPESFEGFCVHRATAHFVRYGITLESLEGWLTILRNHLRLANSVGSR